MRLLVDAHLSPVLARELQARGIDALSFRDWHAGEYRTAPDELVLTIAYAEGRTLVTYDLRTMPVLLQEWAESGQRHAGVVLVDDATIQPDDIGGLIHAPSTLVVESGAASWEDRVVFLRRRQRG